MYYDGSNWKWDNWEDDASEFWERYREAVKDYGNKLNHKGDEMNLRFIERDGKKILQMDSRNYEYPEWVDVPCVEDKKEPRKLWKQILDEAMPLIDNNLYVTCSKNAAKISIDAVIECYEDYMSSPRKIDFKNWLTQRLM